MHIDPEDLEYYAQCRREEEAGAAKRKERLRQGIRASFLRGEMVLALPAGKSLEKQTVALLGAAGIAVKRAHPRASLALLTGLPWCSRAAFCKPSDIPGLLSSGSLAVGITGMDTVHEEQCGNRVGVCTELNYNRMTRGHMRAVLFARADDSVRTMDDLTRKFSGRAAPMPVVSEYVNETKRFLMQHGMSGEVTETRGSSEVLVRLGVHRFGVTLVETGTTLRVNQLREIATIFESTTVLIANRHLLEMPEASPAVADLSQRLTAALERVVQS